MNVVLTTAYWPNLFYFHNLLNADEILVEACENYGKQSFRNRCTIMTANGKLDLTIPVNKQKSKTPIAEIKISYAENWQMNHWRAITSAYNKSPFFEFFEDEISAFYKQKFVYLLEYNTAQLHFILRSLRVQKKINYTETFEKKIEGSDDLRAAIHPKSIVDPPAILMRPYYQTFTAKNGFVHNLSILDLLFNKGLDAKKYLMSKRDT